MYKGLTVEMNRMSVYSTVALMDRLDRYAEKKLTSRSNVTRDLLTEILDSKQVA